MKIMRILNYIYYTFLFLIINSLAFSQQKLVISEYMNISGNADGEWTEILITDNNVNLSGFKIRDNSDTESWRPAATFKSIPLWSNLHIGTIIVLNHRNSGTKLDVNPLDGYIELSLDNTEYFDLETDWMTGSMSINQSHDLVQIIDPAGNNLFCFGHSSQSGTPWTDFQAISTGWKLMYNGSLASASSVRVFPGNDLAGYNLGFDALKTNTVANKDYSKGMANKREAKDPDNTSNYSLWQSLREPVWDNPQATEIKFAGFNASILWTPVSWSLNADEGYMIVRVPESEINSMKLPVDGKIYNIGDHIEGGSGVVVGYKISFGNLLPFIDTTFVKAECGKSYVYYIFAYRYDADDQLKDNEYYGRGRAYNQTHYVKTLPLMKPLPAKPIITSNSGSHQFCEGEEIILKIQGAYTADVTFQWYKDGNKMPNSNSSSITITEAGQYTVGAKNIMSGCEELSEIFSVEILPVPVAKLYLVTQSGNIEITKDTTFYVCKDEDPSFNYPKLQLSGGSVLEWYFDDNLKTEEINEQFTVAAQKGKYFGKVKNGSCFDITPNVSIEYINYKLEISPQPLILDADVAKTGTITLTNNSNIDIVITEPAKFKITNPDFTFIDLQFPIIIPKGKTFEVKVEYNYSGKNVNDAYIQIVLECFTTYKADLRGGKTIPGEAKLSASPSSFDIGSIYQCSADTVVHKIKLESYGTIPAKIQVPPTTLDVKFTTTLPTEIINGESIEFGFTLQNKSEGKHTDTIQIVYATDQNSTKFDTLKIPINYEIVIPSLEFNKDNLVSIATCSDTAFYSFEVTNQNSLPVNINQNFTNTKVQITDLLPIKIDANSTKTIEIRAVSKADDNINEILHLEECSAYSEITFNLKKSNINVAVENNEIDLGTIPLCDNASTNFAINKLNVQGGSVKVKSIQAEEFILDIVVGESISSNKEVKVFYVGNKEGNIEEEITIIFEPCDYEVKFTAKANAIPPSFNLSKSEITRTDAKKDVEINETITITNNSPYQVKYSIYNTLPIISFQTSSFSLNPNLSDDFNIIIKPDSDDKEYYDTLTIVSEPCADTIARIPVHIKTSNNYASGTIKIDLPQAISGDVGETIIIPVKHTTNFDISKADISKLTYYFSYNGKQIYPQDAGLNSSSSFAYTMIFTEESINSATLQSLFTNQPPNQQAIDFNLTFLMLQTNEIVNNLKLDSVNVESKGKISVETDSTIINTNVDCDLTNRNIFIDNSSFSPIIEYKDNQINIEFNTAIDGKVDINLYNNSGELVQNNNFGSVNYGTYQTQLDVSKLISGVYFIEVKTPMGTFTKKIIIVR